MRKRITWRIRDIRSLSRNAMLSFPVPKGSCFSCLHFLFSFGKTIIPLSIITRMSAKGVNVSRDLLWILTKQNSAHTFRRRGIPKTFSTDPFNPKGIETLRNSGNVHAKAATVEANPEGKGVQLVFKKQRLSSRKAGSVVKVPLTRGLTRTARSIKSFVNGRGYRRDLKTVLLRRASAILKSQKKTAKVAATTSAKTTATKKKDWDVSLV